MAVFATDCLEIAKDFKEGGSDLVSLMLKTLVKRLNILTVKSLINSQWVMDLLSKALVAWRRL